MAAFTLLPRLLFASEPPRSVVTTTSILADTVRNLADSRTAVSALMGERVDPHTYKASPGDLRKLSEATIIISNGLHLEGRLADALDRFAARKTVLNATHTIPPTRLRYTDPENTLADPHVWFDPSLWSLVAENITQTLARLDPDRASEYQARLHSYTAEIGRLHTWCASEIRSIPAEHRVLITAHDAFGYFGRAYDIAVHGIQGMSTEGEASIRDINRLVSLIVKQQVPALFIESSVSPRAVEALIEGARAKGVHVTLGGELYSDALGSPNGPEGTYFGMIRHNVRQIKDALTRERS
jgi:manganese/zinc/iron transport system substrate-binding protein